jgi:hypothetical protein
VLLLSGDKDPFAKVELLEMQVKRLKDHDLVIYPGMGHGLIPVAADAAKEIADFL